jgi:hypothetical protein
VALILTGCARLSRSYIQIKNFLNSYRAGAHSNLVTLDVSALFSVLEDESFFYRGITEQLTFYISSKN